MAIKQLSIFVENREGTLVTVTDAIAKAGVDNQTIIYLCRKPRGYAGHRD